MGHLGLTPQSATQLGGMKAQGRTAAAARRLLDDARELEAAGCFALVLEAVPARIARARQRRARDSRPSASEPGPGCDGQVLVWHDLLGMNEGVAPRFVKRYADVAGEIRRGLEAFAAEVRSGAYPADEHVYKIRADELRAFEAELERRDGGTPVATSVAARCARSPRPRPRPPTSRARRKRPGAAREPVAGAEREDDVPIEQRVRRPDPIAPARRGPARRASGTARGRAAASVATTTSVVLLSAGAAARSRRAP